MKKLLCIKCNQEMKWGSFAYNQEICWDCFQKEVKQMIERINQYPSWLWETQEEHTQILNYLLALTAEIHGQKLK